MDTNSRKDLSECLRQATSAMLESERNARAQNWEQDKICKSMKPIVEKQVGCIQKFYKGLNFSDREIGTKFKIEAMLLVKDFNSDCPGYKVEVPRF